MGTAIPSKIYRAILEALNDKESYPKHHSIQLVYFHNAGDNKDKWDGGEHAALIKTIKGILKDMKPVEFLDDNKNKITLERTFQTHEMPHTESDIS